MGGLEGEGKCVCVLFSYLLLWEIETFLDLNQMSRAEWALSLGTYRAQLVWLSSMFNQTMFYLPLLTVPISLTILTRCQPDFPGLTGPG